MKIEEISIENDGYPEQLRNIYDPPLKLFVLGNKEILKQKGIAIVGTRTATESGKKNAYKFAKELSEQGINVISGLAIGIDAYAHLGNLRAQENRTIAGKTIAVLGSGIDKMYPKENTEIARKIIQTGGCIVSEYPCGTKPYRLHFPQRNRIISGLSNGVLVVEASKKSGALITADFALEQGRDVFAILGDISNKNSQGCNELIEDGAKKVSSVEEIIEEIRY